MEHGYCLNWEKTLVFLHVGSDIITGICYYSIPLAMLYCAYRRRDLPFYKIFVLFALFILSCGTTHFFAAYTIYRPEYWLEGYIKAITAVISTVTVFLLIPRIPEAIALPSIVSSMEEIKKLNCDLGAKNAELQQSGERLQLATRATNIGIWDWDVVNNELTWDDSMYTLYGILKENFGGAYDAWVRTIHPEDRQYAEAEIQAALRGEREYAPEFRVICPDGSLRFIKAASQTFFDENGIPLRMIGTNIDITEQRRAEREKVNLEAQLQQAQKMESVGRLAGGVAHDFNNMLGVILGHASLALMEADPAHPFRNSLEEIRTAAERSADLTRQLLAFARKQTIAPKVLDLNETVSAMLKMLQRLIGEDINLTWHPAPNLWPVNMDPSQIDQIFANLCVNSRDSIAGVGKITIETGNTVVDEEYCAQHAGCVSGEYVRLVVSDDGCGMDKMTISHIFEPFFTTKGVGEGTGLGLATVYGIVKQNNGFINVYSEPGLGTTFTIYLPRHLSTVAMAKTEVVAEPALRGQETILLVEDEPSILKITTIILTKQGYTVLTANSPVEAVRVAGEHAGEIHLLMTDVVMPDMNGLDLAKKLLPLYPQLKVLFISGYTANVIAHHGVLDKGMNFLQKPFSLPDLAARVREVLDTNSTWTTG